jgi:cell wall-associated NlpC family hydrolase
LLLTGALGVGLLGAVPAQASPAPTTTRAVAATAVAARAARPASVVTPSAAMRAMIVRGKAVAIARSRLGSRYVAGASGPRRFDCSGLALYVVRKATGRSLPHYSKAQYRATKRVARKNLRPGDLVFFFRHGAHHVGVYIGRGRMISATNPRGGVKIDSVFTGWYGSRYSGAGRLV